MKVWASCCTPTFDAYLPTLGQDAENWFSISPTYIGKLRETGVNPSFPPDFSASDYPLFVQLPELERTMTTITGELTRNDEVNPKWTINSRVSIRVLAIQESSKRALDKLAGGESSVPCLAIGSLSFSGRELSTQDGPMHRVRIKSFQSLCLRVSDPRFGQWIEVEAYKDLLSDPDVIGSPVLRAELEVNI